jgi:hypothetical protein
VYVVNIYWLEVSKSMCVHVCVCVCVVRVCACVCVGERDRRSDKNLFRIGYKFKKETIKRRKTDRHTDGKR